MRISSRRLGEFLVSRRVLSRDALEELLSREATEGVQLSHLLTLEEIVSSHDLMAAVASELGVPFVELAEQTILPDLWALVPEDLARGYLAVALERRPSGVIVAMEDPGDDQVVAALEEELGAPVLPAVAARDDLQRLIDQMYGSPEGSDDKAWADAPVEGPRRGRLVAGPRTVQLDDLLAEVLRAGGSDLHLAVGTAPLVRVQGVLRRIPGMPPLTGSDTRRLVLGVLTRSQQERFLAAGELSSSHAIPGRGRFRVSAFVQRDSVGAVLRMVPPEIPPAEDLGLPDEVIAWTEERRGLVLVCGPHGSGISTTLAALVDRINRSRAAHILTIEDPIEFLHRHQAGLVNQREVGEDTASVASGLRVALRQDPDVIVASELPDTESLRLALAAAETGHLVLGALRTMDAVQTVERIVDVFPIDQQPQVRVQLANTLRGIVVQQLVPAVDEGLALATEVLLPTKAVLDHIRAGDSANLAKAILGGATSGMGTMDQSLAALVQDGIVAPEVAADRAVDPAELQYLLSGHR
ncbi:MAG TPA: PilT/PilU family type 4a pilus ATPase [Acidimicrobiales bacterium]|nr:PilT/PilU family type 4a pilus ATPase [Acidimicrobiales bacterium]